jgi:hypothetical protein
MNVYVDILFTLDHIFVFLLKIWRQDNGIMVRRIENRY